MIPRIIANLIEAQAVVTLQEKDRFELESNYGKIYILRRINLQWEIELEVGTMLPDGGRIVFHQASTEKDAQAWSDLWSYGNDQRNHELELKRSDTNKMLHSLHNLPTGWTKVDI